MKQALTVSLGVAALAVTAGIGTSAHTRDASVWPSKRICANSHS